MEYDFKLGPEAIWFAFVTVVAAVAQVIANQGNTPPTDLGLWLSSIAIAAARALIGALLDAVRG